MNNTKTDEREISTCRSALEGLRNGVPNEASVKMLGCHQPQVESRFHELLSQAIVPATLRSSGMLVSGGFGSGKSHLLTYLEHQALSKGFVCSRISISKETPLYHLDKVFKSAIDYGRMPDRTGQLMGEIKARLEKSPAYARFFDWANSEHNGLHPLFPATLKVHEMAIDPDHLRAIISFWSGEKPKVSVIKNSLRETGHWPHYSFKAPKAKELPPQRLRFATELIKGAGYKGWVVLLDEIELVGSYTLPQRAKSYAELARWLGKIEGEEYPGLVVVGTVTDDFVPAILGDVGKKDRHNAAHRLRSRGEDAVAAMAETGMRILERETIPLTSPTDEDVHVTIEKLRDIYSTAYEWESPQIEGKAGKIGDQGRMRYTVRAAINEWDLLRLYPDYRPETVVTPFQPTYEEIRELEKETKDGGDEAETR